MNKKMKIEVWSDIMCPFCYMGKRKFENALAQFADRDNVEVEWKSFQLMPELKTDTSIKIHDYLASVKGFPVEQAKQMNNQVAQAGKEVGLEYNFDKVVVANTFMAHELLHFAKKQGKQNEAKENLMNAFFTHGKNVDDLLTLLEIGKETGLDVEKLEAALKNETYAGEVQADIREAQQLGARGVPFFVFNRKYAVSGAQESTIFLQTLEKSFEEWKKENPGALLEVIDGKACNTDGDCD